VTGGGTGTNGSPGDDGARGGAANGSARSMAGGAGMFAIRSAEGLGAETNGNVFVFTESDCTNVIASSSMKAGSSGRSIVSGALMVCGSNGVAGRPLPRTFTLTVSPSTSPLTIGVAKSTGSWRAYTRLVSAEASVTMIRAASLGCVSKTFALQVIVSSFRDVSIHNVSARKFSGSRRPFVRSIAAWGTSDGSCVTKRGWSGVKPSNTIRSSGRTSRKR
jgi:hypothetical protein